MLRTAWAVVPLPAKKSGIISLVFVASVKTLWIVPTGFGLGKSGF